MRDELAEDRVVALVASAGGLAAIRTILERLPREFPFPILVLVHLWPKSSSHLAEILNTSASLRVTSGADGELLERGRVYVACPDWHMTVDASHRIRLTQSPAVHFVRPSADVLLSSVAAAYGSKGIGVVCTGGGHDGAAGLLELRRAGGVTIAQDEATSEHFGMPGSAIAAGAAGEVLPLQDIAPALVALARQGNGMRAPFSG